MPQDPKSVDIVMMKLPAGYKSLHLSWRFSWLLFNTSLQSPHLWSKDLDNFIFKRSIFCWINDKKEIQYYLEKRLVYKTKSSFRTIWGRIRHHHGNNGTFIVKFLDYLLPRRIGVQCYILKENKK